MYARLAMFTLEEGKREVADELAEKMVEAMQELKGFKQVIFLSDESINEYGALSLWETKEDAEQAGAALAPEFMKTLHGHLQGMPIRRVLEAHEGLPVRV